MVGDNVEADAEGKRPEAPEPEPGLERDAWADEEIPAWMSDMDEYPLRDASQDPRWAVRMVSGWVVFAFLSILFVLVLLFLGFYYAFEAEPPAVALIRQKCVLCHPLERVREYTGKDWDKQVELMRSFGAPVSEQEARTIADFLKSGRPF